MNTSLSILEKLLEDLKNIPLTCRKISLENKSGECGDDLYSYKEYTISHPELEYSVSVCYGDYSFFGILPYLINDALTNVHKKIIEKAFRMQNPDAIFNMKKQDENKNFIQDFLKKKRTT